MFSVAPVITETGKTLLLRAAGGEQITFTKFQAGSGVLDTGETPETMTALKNVVLSNIPLIKAEGTEDEGFIEVTGRFDNQTDVTQDFRWTELGLIAEDEDGHEYLYAYGYDDEYADLIKAGASDVVTEQTINVIVAIGDSENITVWVLPHDAYVTTEDFQAHLAATNPHNVTYSQVGAAAANHTHSASEITSGTFPIERGGTGVSTYEALMALLGINFVFGEFTGNGSTRKDISIGFQPAKVWIFMAGSGYDQGYVVQGHPASDNWRIAAINGAYYFGYQENIYPTIYRDQPIYGTCDANTLLSRGYGGAAVIADGFAVGYHQNYMSWMNRDGIKYLYVAFRP